MPYGYEDINSIPNFKSDEEEYQYARERALAYFKGNSLAEYCIWESNYQKKLLFVANIGGGIYESYRLGDRIE